MRTATYAEWRASDNRSHILTHGKSRAKANAVLVTVAIILMMLGMLLSALTVASGTEHHRQRGESQAGLR